MADGYDDFYFEGLAETTARASPDQGRGVGGDVCEAGRGEGRADAVEGRIPSEFVCQEGSFRPQSIRNRHVPSVLQGVVDGPQLQACEESVEMRLLLRAPLKGGVGRRAAEVGGLLDDLEGEQLRGIRLFGG